MNANQKLIKEIKNDLRTESYIFDSFDPTTQYFCLN